MIIFVVVFFTIFWL